MWGGIRIRLLVLAAGVGIPIAYVGLVGILAMWGLSRQQLYDSIENHAEIAGAAFEQWLEGQRAPLATLAAQYAGQPLTHPGFLNTLRVTAVTRSHWLGVRIINSAGETLAAQPAEAPSLSQAVARNLLMQLNGREWAIDTDWSRGQSSGVLMICIPLNGNEALIAQLDVAAASDAFLRKVKFSDEAVFSVFGPQRRVILYRNSPDESHLGRDMTDSPLLAALGEKQTASTEVTSSIDGVRRMYGLTRAGETGCIAMVGIPRYGEARDEFTRYLVFTLAGLLLAMLAAVGIARSIAGPVRKLSEAARRFGAGDTSTRARFQTSGELEELRASFNSMAVKIEEREARLSELDRLKSEFVSGVSHEMRTPLTTIKTLTRVLLRDKATELERREFLEMIMAECDRQIDLVLNLLDLSRIEAGTFNISLTQVNVADVVNSCAKAERRGAEARGHQLKVHLQERLPAVMADGNALRRVVCGLIQNASKYTPDGGSITVAACSEADELRISVTDTGPGISPDDSPHIFEKFYRGHSRASNRGNGASPESVSAGVEGVGLGLFLARRIIGEIGGRIELKSNLGEGSVFTIVLPALPDLQRTQTE